MRKKPPIPACPDPDRYVLVETRRRYYWRKKRGTVTPVKLNKAFATNVEIGKLAGPVSKRIMAALSPYTTNLETGWLNLHITNVMRRGFKSTSEFNLSFLKEFEIQERFPLEMIVIDNYEIKVEADSIKVRIPIFIKTLKRPARQTDLFNFDLVLLWGDPAKDNKLRTEQATSELYSFREIHEEYEERSMTNGDNMEPRKFCDLQLILPGQNIQWIALLKISCQYENCVTSNSKYYGMKVIAGSAGKEGG